MIKLYMIVGFLGAGKTTFLKNLIGLLSGQRLMVIVNEFGRNGVDGALLSELGVAVEEISNGSIFCSCRIDQFESVLAQSIEKAPEVILVEASGLSDPTHVERLLSRPEFAQIAYMGSICLVDAVNLKKVISTARVCKKQLAVSDTVLINKTDLVSEQELEETERLVRTFSRPDARVYRTSFGRVWAEWLDGGRKAMAADESPSYHLKDVSLRKTQIFIRGTATYAQLESFLKMFIEDTYRVKGFVCLEELEGRSLLVDCVGAGLSIKPYEGKTENCNMLVAMAGAGLRMEESIAKAMEWYPQCVEKLEPGD